MSGVPPSSLPPDDNRSPNLLASLWTPFPFAFITLVARIWVRFARRSMGWDDYFMLIAFVLYVAAVALSTEIIELGGVLHIEYVNPANLPLILKLEFVSQPFGILAVTFAKNSVAVLLYRLLDASSFYRRYLLLILIFLYFVISIASIGVLYGQCDPSKALWEPQLLANGQATCWNPNVNTDFQITQGAYGAFLDFLLALLPISIVWNLNMSLTKKIQLASLLSLGIFAGICASIKTAQFFKAASRTDPTYDSYDLYLWAGLEIPFVIIGGNVPPAKPLWDRLVRGKPLQATAASADNSTNKSYKMWSKKKGTTNDDSTFAKTDGSESNVGISQAYDEDQWPVRGERDTQSSDRDIYQENGASPRDHV